MTTVVYYNIHVSKCSLGLLQQLNPIRNTSLWSKHHLTGENSYSLHFDQLYNQPEEVVISTIYFKLNTVLREFSPCLLGAIYIREGI